MKKLLTILLCAVMLLSLCACGGETETAGGDEPVITIGIKTEEDPTEGVTDAQATTVADPEDTTEQTQNDEAAEKMAQAETCIGKSVEELYQLIGQPNSSDYAPSCLVEGGEDGMLYYDGFVVYTIKSADGERVDFVEENDG